MRKLILKIAILVIISTGLILNVYANDIDGETMEEKYIAIIIDDFGNGTKDTQAMIDLDIPYTAAIMPNREFSVSEMNKLHALGKGIIVHMPMEPEKGNSSWLGKGAITVGLKKEDIRENVLLAFEQLEYATGLNNHMGSKITKDEEILQEIISIVKEKDMIMIDSLTTRGSKVKEICERLDANFLERDIFLDAEGSHNLDFVEKRMLKAGEIAKEKGYAVAIGHVGKAGGLNTVKGISNIAPKLEEEGIRFVTVKELFDILKEKEK